MSKNLQSMLREALLNNSYDYSHMHSSLHRAWENSYSYLYDLQKQYIGYEENHYLSNNVISRNKEVIGKLYLNKTGDACFDIDYEFVHTTSDKKFYKSKFFHTDFTFMDMVNNPDIFYKVPIILIDDQVIYDYKLLVEHHTTHITLPFKETFVVEPERDPETDDIIYVEHKIQVLIVDNDGYYRGDVNINTFTKDATNYTLSYWKQNGFCNVAKGKTGLYFVSFHIPTIKNKNGIKGHELGSFFYPCTEDPNDTKRIKIQLTKTMYETLVNCKKNFYMSIIFVNEINWHTLYTGKNYVTCQNGECEVFMLEHSNRKPYAMPIPAEDLIVVKRRGDKDVLIKNTDAVKLYYPNIYRIIDEEMQEGDEYHFLYFYHNAERLKYDPAFSYYYDYLDIHYENKPLEEIIDKLVRGLIDTSTEYDEEGNEAFKKLFDKMMNYNFYNHKYGEIDFSLRLTEEEKAYIESESEEEYIPTHETEYKDETLKKWINEVNPFYLRDYVVDQDKLYYPVYHLWTNTLDLKTRLRKDTRSELGKDLGYDLEEECYVFSFRNEDTKLGKMLDIRIFVDGLYAARVHQVRHVFTDFFYIPVTNITDDSYIEIEVFPNYSHIERMTFTSTEESHDVTLLEPEDEIYPTAEDLYYISPTGYMLNPDYQSKSVVNDTTLQDTAMKIEAKSAEVVSVKVDDKPYEVTEIYDRLKFEITAKYKEGDFVVKTTNEEKPVKFTRLKQFSIKPLTEDVIGKEIVMCISKTPYGVEFVMQKGGYPYIFLGDTRFNFDNDYIRVFHNGRLIPKIKYELLTSYSIPRLQMFEYCEEGDSVYIDITPYKYKEIYYRETLDSVDEIVDLKEVITKPFDIRYYDVYMNGRKLSLNNVFTLSPWQITFVNLKSISHLTIYEKERDWEYFGTNYKDRHYYYSIEDLLNEPFITEEEKKKLVEKWVGDQKEPELNVKPNENTEDPLDYKDRRKYAWYESFYFNELIPKTYVNPDYIQFDTKVLQEEYPVITNTYIVNPADSYRNDSEKKRRETYIPALDLNPDIYVEGENEARLEYAFMVGHPFDHVDEQIMKMNTYIEEKRDAKKIDTYKKNGRV